MRFNVNEYGCITHHSGHVSLEVRTHDTARCLLCRRFGRTRTNLTGTPPPYPLLHAVRQRVSVPRMDENIRRVCCFHRQRVRRLGKVLPNRRSA
jgi:hypothetical protein